MRTVRARFEVSLPGYGVIEHVQSKQEAQTVANNFCARDGAPFVEVFDRMARIGQTELWQVNVTFKVENGRTNCIQIWDGIQRRGMK
jgi:hypothetical protein